jgi:hypothetical protein
VSTERNLVDVLDELLSLYGPVLVKLLEANPEAHGVRTFIGRENPSALLMDEGMRGYRLEEDEEFAEDELLPLVEATEDLQASCGVISGLREPMSVEITRSATGLGRVTAGVRDGLGSVYVQRSASAFEYEGGIGLFCRPAVAVVTAFSERRPDLEALSAAAEHGIREVVEAMLESDLVLNRKGKGASIVRRFLDQFPTGKDAPVTSKEVGQRVIAFRVGSSQDPVKILATDACADAIGEGFEGVPVVRIPEPPEPYSPTF